MAEDENKPEDEARGEAPPPGDDAVEDAAAPEAPNPEVEPEVGPEPEPKIGAELPPSHGAAPPERPMVIDTETPNQRLERNAPRRKTRKPFRLGRFLWGLTKLGVFVGVILPVALVTIYKWVPPPVTYLMVQRAVEGKGLDYRWRPLSKISPNLVRAAVAAEDGKFCDHRGFDFEAIEKAMANNERGRRLRGGSTISQQTAKNVFLWPGRSYVRKGLEAYFTVLIEGIWGKQRIMEVYLNVIEMGPGTYGAQAASRRYFGVDAAKLSPSQAARLTAILPNPLKYKAVKSGPYVQKRVRRIGGAAGAVRREGLAACVI